MSAIDLGALLADAAQGGAYFVDARDRAALVEAATALDFAVVAIDCASVRDKDQALQRIAQALCFPDWFGGNWDALQDCLDDLSWLPASGYLLLFDHSGGWREAAPEDFATLLDVLNDAAQGWADAGTPFWALLPLPSERLAEIEG